MEIPVTISGFIIGILVTELIKPLTYLLRILRRPSAAIVPITVERQADATARINVFFRAVKVAALLKSSRYQYSEKPVKTPVLLVLLKEKSIKTRIGVYSMRRINAV